MKQNTLSYKVKQYLMFAGPGTILFFCVVIVPFLYGVYLTFTSWDGVSAKKPWVGLANYAAAFADKDYWAALGRTAIYSIFAVVLINILAFFLAYLVTSGVKGQNFF
ncbi:MAG: sugar ABC transporter permease, partial [Oscillospiraceae bacterium]|nr:sugar ABC transporter permease [Oscillospiraceae bacterium]